MILLTTIAGSYYVLFLKVTFLFLNDYCEYSDPWLLSLARIAYASFPAYLHSMGESEPLSTLSLTPDVLITIYFFSVKLSCSSSSDSNFTGSKCDS
jgi:hypothetical protein